MRRGIASSKGLPRSACVYTCARMYACVCVRPMRKEETKVESRVWMVREFQKHTDSSPIPRSDIGEHKQVDTRLLCGTRSNSSNASCRVNSVVNSALLSAMASRGNAVDPINSARNAGSERTRSLRNVSFFPRPRFCRRLFFFFT